MAGKVVAVTLKQGPERENVTPRYLRLLHDHITDDVASLCSQRYMYNNTIVLIPSTTIFYPRDHILFVTLNVAGSAKTDIITNSILLNIYNLHTHAPANFSLAFGVTYSPTNYKINLYSKQWKNKLKVHTKTVVTFEYRFEIRIIMLAIN